ncbi:MULTISPECIES: hypothetical protein [unclassified Sedimentibacter]|uniref:hypothetical protein n=1 Tax=unclassified Sedimentibacter TaxID=2649220 RepID=UPI0027DFD883|nr:hypothetical protein [Sedimentibacter sp. MB35-C1]WMJ78515.1 hypothetical protein RBQ61_06225 [Sedimentibacter sp. MB35-C1]
MQKAINIECSNKNVVRILSIAEPEIIENNPTGLEYFIIEDYVEPFVLDNPLAINYPMYDKVNKTFKWAQIQYQNTATEELLEIENLKIENTNLKNELQVANGNIDMLTETLADMIGGAI